jgi:hypothetical protein
MNLVNDNREYRLNQNYGNQGRYVNHADGRDYSAQGTKNWLGYIVEQPNDWAARPVDREPTHTHPDKNCHPKDCFK